MPLLDCSTTDIGDKVGESLGGSQASLHMACVLSKASLSCRPQACAFSAGPAPPPAYPLATPALAIAISIYIYIHISISLSLFLSLPPSLSCIASAPRPPFYSCGALWDLYNQAEEGQVLASCHFFSSLLRRHIFYGSSLADLAHDIIHRSKAAKLPLSQQLFCATSLRLLRLQLDTTMRCITSAIFRAGRERHV